MAARPVDDNDALSTFAIAPSVSTATVVAYTLTVTDANNNSVEDTINVRIRPMPTPLLNDTGFLQQATNNALTEAQQNDFPGQDGQRGADIIEQNGLIEKAGRGKAGFDFTRLNANGDEQDAAQIRGRAFVTMSPDWCGKLKLTMGHFKIKTTPILGTAKR